MKNKVSKFPAPVLDNGWGGPIQYRGRGAAVVIALGLASNAALFAQVVSVPQAGLSPVGGAAGASFNPAQPRSAALSGPSLFAPTLGGSLISNSAPAVVKARVASRTIAAAVPDVQTAPAVSAQALSEIPSFEAPAQNTEGPSVSEASKKAVKEDAHRPSIISRLTRAVAARLDFRRVFDAAPVLDNGWGGPIQYRGRGAAPRSTLLSELGVTAKPLKPIPLPQGVELDPAPTAPLAAQVPTVQINSFGDFEAAEIPGTVNTGGVFDNAPIVLQADPSSEPDMERALRALVSASPDKYGITGAELSTIHVRRVPGKEHQADTFFGYFRQQKNGIVVHDSSLSFTVKVLAGKPVLVASMAKLYKNIAVETASPFSDAELRTRAQQRIGLPPEAASEMTFIGKKIIFSHGSWHAANLYSIQGLPVMIAVDIATGEAFAWDARQAFQEEDADGAKKSGGLAGQLLGRGEANDTRPEGKPVLVPLPMTNNTITLADGRAVTTGKDGKFVVEGKDGSEMSFGAALEGTWAKVTDSQGRVLKLNGTLKPGTEGTYTYNPTEADEWILNMINSFQGVNRVHDWLRERFNDPRIDKAIPVNANIDQECNAYYTPGSPSLNFFKSSEMCSDTARPGIIAHEYGHFWDDMIGGIVNGGLSEGWGDILSMYIFGSPIIGDGFLKNPSMLDNMRDVFWGFMRRIRLAGPERAPAPRPSYIRHGENTHPYNANDEVHDQGQVWMGFAWKLRVALIESMGAAAGAAMAEALVIPTMFAKAADIPSAIAQVLLSDMDKSGNMPHEKEIRAAAKAHGITLPKNPGGLALKLAQAAGEALGGASAQN